jgi:hypothetical protein
MQTFGFFVRREDFGCGPKAAPSHPLFIREIRGPLGS